MPAKKKDTSTFGWVPGERLRTLHAKELHLLLGQRIGCGSKLNDRGKPQVLVQVSTQGQPLWTSGFVNATATWVPKALFKRRRESPCPKGSKKKPKRGHVPSPDPKRQDGPLGKSGPVARRVSLYSTRKSKKRPPTPHNRYRASKTTWIRRLKIMLWLSVLPFGFKVWHLRNVHFSTKGHPVQCSSKRPPWNNFCWLFLATFATLAGCIYAYFRPIWQALNTNDPS